MRIRSQFILSMVVFSMVLSVIALSAVFTGLQVAQLSSQQDIAEAIQSDAGHLNQISTDYFLKQEDIQLEEWQQEFDSLVSKVESLKPANSEQSALLARIDGDMQQLDPAFSAVATYLQNTPRNLSVRMLPEFQAIWGNLSKQNQALASDSALLSQAMGNESDALKAENSVIIVALLCAVGGYFVTNYLVVYRNALRSISRLQEGTKVVGSGNFDYSIEKGGKDEVGELSDAFNQMTASLKDLTISKKQLESEVLERKKVERQLEESKIQLEKEKNLLQAIMNEPKNMHLVYLDKGFNFLRVNEAYAKTCGYKPEEMIGKNHFALYPNEENEAVFARVRDTGEPVGFHDKAFVFPDQPERGVTFWDWTLSPIRNGSGVVEGLVFALVETTERKKAERALEDAQSKLKEYATSLEQLVEERTRQLRDSERLAGIGQTAGMVGHDIRNPLQAIMGDVYLLKSDLSSLPEGEEKESMQESLESIEQNVAYVNKIVQDLQDFARPLKPDSREVDVEALCEGILFKNGVPENVEKSCKVERKAKKIFSDPDLLRRVLSNLVSNAIQAMPNGGRLFVNAFREAGDVVITVGDTGMGIPEEARSKLFMPLFTTKSKGQGFGLAVVRRITEALGGTIDFESEVGKGTKFNVRLPWEAKFAT